MSAPPTRAEVDAIADGVAEEEALRAAQQTLLAREVWDDLRGARFAVLGLGVSGIAAANALCARGADVVAFDDKPEEALADALRRLDPRVRARCGQGYTARPAEIAVVSPGLSPHTPTFRRAKASALAIVGEIELFYRLDRAANAGRGHPIIAITGTDGKTTTTLLIDHLLRQAGYKTACAGNIGDPLCSVVDSLAPDAVVVAEVSEFQLVTTSAFRPRVLVLTNVADDHLDWFAGDRLAYIDSMVAPALRLGPGEAVVVNGHDPALQALADALGARTPRGPALALFSGRRDLSSVGGMADRFAIVQGALCLLGPAGHALHLAHSETLGADAGRPMLGVHNLDNALAACAAVLALGVPLTTLGPALRTFRLPSHRLEPAGAIGGVRFVDDSKATNPHAAIHGLRATPLGTGERLAWIGGGSEKDSDFKDIAAEVAATASVAFLIGATAPRLRQSLLAAGLDDAAVEVCDSMPDAVARSYQALAGADGKGQGVVLLSPACASFGMFSNYAQRGDLFQDAVRALGRALSR